MTLLSPRPSEGSAYTESRASVAFQDSAERLRQAQAQFDAGAFDRSLVILRAHLLDDAQDAAALALALDAGAKLAPGEKEKWSGHSAHAARMLRSVGALAEKDSARTGQLLLQRGETAIASIVAADIARRFPNSDQAADFLAAFYARVGEPAAALARLMAASRAHPDALAVAWAAIERGLRAGRGDLVAELAEGLATRDRSSRTLMMLARVRIAAGAPETAAELALEAVRADGAVGGPTAVARALAQAGRAEEASGLVDALVALAPQSAELARLRADLRKAAGRDAEALDDLQRAMRLEPSLPVGEALADLLLATGRTAEAAELVDAFERLKPGGLAPDILRAKLLRAAGDAAAAEALEADIDVRAVIQATAPAKRQRVRITGMVGPGGLGDFVYQVLALCSIKAQFVDAGLTMLYSNDQSYKADILRFCPHIEDARDYAAGTLAAPIGAKHNPDFRQHLFFSQSALSPTLLARLDRTATLVTPPEDVDGLTAGLIARGLDPDRWFVAMHYRQNTAFTGFSFGGAAGIDHLAARDVNPEPFHQLAAAICAAGGQVVRLGHPGMPPLPKIEGYVDLSDGGLPMQLFAVSKARFMVACDSGPTSYAAAFKTPLFKTNTFSEDGAAYAGDLLLTKNLVNWRGEVISTASMLDGRRMLLKQLPQSESGFRLLDNTLEQLQHGVERMMSATSGGGWRADTPPLSFEAPDVLDWPTRTEPRAEILDLSHLAGRPVRTIDPALMRAALGLDIDAG